MENDFDFDLEDRENFKINPEIWLSTLLAIAGDKEKKEQVLQNIARKTGISPQQAGVVMMTTISILINQTRSN
jgi:hypothetical protein